MTHGHRYLCCGHSIRLPQTHFTELTSFFFKTIKCKYFTYVISLLTLPKFLILFAFHKYAFFYPGTIVFVPYAADFKDIIYYRVGITAALPKWLTYPHPTFSSARNVVAVETQRIPT